MKYRSNTNPVFRSKFSEDIFNQKYAHGGAETWDELASTVVEDVCREDMSKEEKSQLKEYIRQLKFIPGGRYLYYAGRPAKYFNNCFSGDTRVMTNRGMLSMKTASRWSHAFGETLTYRSPLTGEYVDGNMNIHGEQQLYDIVFAPLRGRSKQRWVVEATRDHRWPLIGGTVTDNLQVGDKIQTSSYSYDGSDEGFLHGFIFGDGTRQGQARMCGDKAKHLGRIKNLVSVTYPDHADGDPCIYADYRKDWKELPKTSKDPEYIAGFIRGWLAADGHGGRMLHSTCEKHIKWFRDHAVYAGLTITGAVRHQDRDITLGKYTYLNHRIYMVNFSEGGTVFKVESITPSRIEDVYCPSVQGERIIIENNIDTFNCYLLRAEEDTREDWANLSWRAESCLMTGGGIGVDYSVYRPEGAPLGRTGGVASGPIPKMNMINEIGRNVMQGGSRRSAIYASLNWKHGDAESFLKAKDWHNMPVGASGKSLWDIKQEDFNFPAPLDMTNISLNYDTEWLTNYWETGDYGSTFRANVEQALRTGEPGFSFNFFDKENETLRNACTEVTSEDDSDVCNLGSINMGRVDSITEMADIVALSTKFLLCGTLRADLPYDKVREVRQKNRRLGLGLMGMHEWLLKKGQRYEVTPELHQWLTVYRGVSDSTATQFAESLGVSRPIAVRAIAPTGSIGILAGTTTGIEPLFAVAYKRRFLKGKKWHYQYVVDGAAQELIDIYGIDPDTIDTSIDLAEDPERRLKFQADVQDYVDQSISSTINLPSWGSNLNNEDSVGPFAKLLADYAPRLRGFTCYPDGARGGQPLTTVSYAEAVEKLGETFEEAVQTHDVCEITGVGGSCGV